VRTAAGVPGLVAGAAVLIQDLWLDGPGGDYWKHEEGVAGSSGFGPVALG